MCGIYGTTNLDTSLLRKMASFDYKRGPDNFNIANISDVYFAHNLLHFSGSFDHATQPIKTKKNNLFAFAGEVYNYQELAKYLGLKFNDSISDTEVICFGLEKEGESFLEKLDGMFAIAFFNSKKNQLILARDQFGTKPLYYTNIAGGISFSSSIPSMRYLPIKFELNYFAINLYLTLGYFPFQFTPIEEINSVPNGTVISFDLSKKKNEIKQIKLHKSACDDSKSFEETILSTYEVNSDKNHSGILLSGGLDSSLIYAILKKNSCQITPIISMQKGWKNEDYKYAIELCNQFSDKPLLVEYDVAKFNNFFESAYSKVNEPRYNPSFFLYDYVIGEASKNSVRMLLSGDGADELFGGYNRYHSIMSKLPEDYLNTYFDITKFNFQANTSVYASDELANFTKDRYMEIASHIDINNNDTSLKRQLKCESQIGWLVNEALPRGDTIGAKYSIELRYPFMRSDTYSLAMSLDDKQLCDKSTNKIYLKNLAKKYLPDELIYQKKVGWNFNYWDDFKNQKLNIYAWLKDKRDNFISIIDTNQILQSGNKRVIFSWFSLLLWYENNKW